MTQVKAGRYAWYAYKRYAYKKKTRSVLTMLLVISLRVIAT